MITECHEIHFNPRSRANASFCDILLGGSLDPWRLAPSLNPAIRKLRQSLAGWRKLSYAELAFEILSLFIDDIPADDLRAICQKTYTPAVYCHSRAAETAKHITPLTWLEPGLGLLELSNGPTLAFKDMAMQLLGDLFEYVLAKRGEQINILGATSGDTGSAAEYAMRGKRGIKVFMLSPEGKMSAFQRAQMYSLQDENIINIAVRGMFDDAQDIVKAVSNDAQFKARYKIGAVNSINWARVAAQVVSLFQGLFRGDAIERRTGGVLCAVRQLRQHLCRPCGAHDGTADRQTGAGDKRKQCAGRVLPQRCISPASNG